MVKKVFYEKVGRRYRPVREYDSELMSAMHKGSHLVVCNPGTVSYRYDIDPNYAALIAAARLSEDVISNEIVRATEIRRHRGAKDDELTPEQKAAWDNLIAVFGPSAKQLEWPSAREAAEAAVSAMVNEAKKLMNNEAVRLAYEHFQMVCELTKEHK